MSEGSTSNYTHSVTHNTRRANEALAARTRQRKGNKRGIEALDEVQSTLAEEGTSGRKGKRKQFGPHLNVNDQLRQRDEEAPRTSARAGRVRAPAPSISRSVSRATDGSTSTGAYDADYEMSDYSALPSPHPAQVQPSVRISEPIGRNTDILQALPASQMMTLEGLPFEPRPVPELDSDEEAEEAARNTNVEQLAAFASSQKPLVYAHCVIDRDGPPPADLICSLCHKPGTARWRCDGCQRNRDLCTRCIRETHMSTPFHRVRYLAAQQYTEAWLRDAGVFIQLCPLASGTSLCRGYEPEAHTLPDDHDNVPPPLYGSARSGPLTQTAEYMSDAGGEVPGASVAPRPRRTAATGPNVAGPANNRDEEVEEIWIGLARKEVRDEGEDEGQLQDADDEAEVEEMLEGTARRRGRDARLRKDPWGYPVMVIVDDTDIHQLGVAYCQCSGGGLNMPYDQQLIKLGGLMPATAENPKTCFTVQGLRYHHIDRLECKVAPQAMMRKLRRHTSPLHPSTVPNRYPELLRLCREWTVIDNLITHGYAHQALDEWTPPPPGGLFHRCVTCPSSKNVPEGYKDDPNSWAVFYSLVHDGNFSAQHTVSRQPGNNIPIFPGTGAFQHPDDAKADLKSMKNDRKVKQEKPELFENDKPCHKHVAAQMTGKTKDKITDIKGIGAWACARHGEFCAGGTCNYDLGEASKPADVALNNVFKLNTDLSLADRIQLLYDIWCRYGIHLKERFNRSPNVTWPQFREVLGGVGVWHIYGHVFECYGRWSNLYARRTGIVDGEILETLWSVLNQILESCRGMSLASREEVISLYESDSNHRKNLAMVDTIAKKVAKYSAEQQSRAALVDQLSLSTSPDEVAAWEIERQNFERDRITDSTAADKFFKQDLVQVPSRKDTEVALLEEEANNPDGKPLVKAIIDAMNVQVDQLKLQALITQSSDAKSDRADIATSRTKLNNRIIKSNAAMEAALGSAPAKNELAPVRLRRLMVEDEWDTPSDRLRDKDKGRKLRPRPELKEVDMPSARGANWRSLKVEAREEDDTAIRKRAMSIQRRVVVAQLEESLGEIRTRIVDQANTFLHKIRSRGGNVNQGYYQANMAYKEAQNQGKAVRIHAQIYNICREKLEDLHWDNTVEGLAQKKRLEDRYKELFAGDLRCSTQTYSTTGTSPNFNLPWFWRMVGANVNETAEEAAARDEAYIAEFFRIRWVNAMCSLTRCKEELIILRFEMQMCYLGYVSLAADWVERGKRMRGHRAHEFLAQEYASNWLDMAAYAKLRFNLCWDNVIYDGLKVQKSS